MNRPDNPPQRRVRVHEKAPSLAALGLVLEDTAPPVLNEDEVLVAVKSAGVNPSDAKALLGNMPHAVWPRTPGRDYAGVVVDGPAQLLGLEVWGSGGDLGIRRDGSHARYLVLSRAAVRAKPKALSLLEAGAVGVPFVTAFEGLRRAGPLSAEDAVVVFGASGKVGQAAVQLARRAGATVFAVSRRAPPYAGPGKDAVHVLSSSTDSVEAVVRDSTQGRGARIVFNAVGSPYFETASRVMGVGAVQILIATVERSVPFDIFTFYRGQHTFVGVDSLALDAVACAGIFEELAVGFDDGSLEPFTIRQDHVFSLEEALAAYTQVLAGSEERVLLTP